MSIQLAFEEFHDANPGIYEAFKRLIFDGISRGKTRMSAHFLLKMLVWARASRSTTTLRLATPGSSQRRTPRTQACSRPAKSLLRKGTS